MFENIVTVEGEEFYNQRLEKEDSFLLSLYMQMQKEHAIDYILKNPNLDSDSLLEAHGILLDGTCSSKKFDNFNCDS